MKTNAIKKQDLNSLATIHIVLAILIPFLITFMMSGCAEDLLEKAENKNRTLGDEISVTKVDKAISKALSGINAGNLIVGNGSLYEWNIRVENSSIQKIAEFESHVIARVETEKSIKITLLDTTRQYEGNTQTDEVTKESTIEILKSEFQQQSDARHMTNLQNMLNFYNLSSQTFTKQEKPWKITYHNLTTAQTNQKPPRRVRDMPNCGDVPKCLIPVTKLNYDRVEWSSPSERKIINIRHVLTNSIHFLAPLLSSCKSYFSKIQGQNYLLNDCNVLREF